MQQHLFETTERFWEEDIHGGASVDLAIRNIYYPEREFTRPEKH